MTPLANDHPLVVEAEAILGTRRYDTLRTPEPNVYMAGDDPDMRIAIVHDRNKPNGALGTELREGRVFLTWNTKDDPATMQVGARAALVGKVVRFALATNQPRHLVLSMLDGLGGTVCAVQRGLAVALQDGGYCKTGDRYVRPETIRLLGDIGGDQESDGAAFGRHANLAAWLTTLPCNVLDPVTYASLVETLVRNRLNHNAGVTMLRPTDNEMARMGLMNAVAQGSEVPGQVTAFVVNPLGGPTQKVVRVIGKGVCMDIGGVDVKDAKAMQLMNQDMRGSAVVNAVGLLAMCHPEVLRYTTVFAAGYVCNLIGPRAYLTEGVYTAYNGKRVRIQNTDAEGRLVLADVGAWLRERFAQPGPAITVATLTGHAHVVSGDSASVALVGSNDYSLRSFIEETGNEVGDPFDTLRYRSEHGDGMRDPVADYANLAKVPPGHVGCQSAYHFVREFVGDGIHLDIAKGCTVEGDASTGRAKGLSNDAGFGMLHALLGHTVAE